MIRKLLLALLLILAPSLAFGQGFTSGTIRQISAIRTSAGQADTVKVTNGGVHTSPQERPILPFDVYFSQIETDASTLSVDASIDAYTFEATAGHTITVGTQLVLFDSVSNRIFVGEALVAGATTIDLDTPLNFSYPAATTTIVTSDKEMNVDGSVTRQTFSVAPPILSGSIHITRIMFQMTTVEFPELNMFGDIVGPTSTGLVRGLMVRVVNGRNINLFNVDTNGELVNLMFDLNFYEAAKHGVNGLSGRFTYGGPGKHGGPIELGPGDSIEAIVQDPLQTLLSFRMIAAGYLVE